MITMITMITMWHDDNRRRARKNEDLDEDFDEIETDELDQGCGGHQDASLEEADGKLAEAQAARGREDAGFLQ